MVAGPTGMPTRMGEQAATPTVKRKNGFFSSIFKRKRDENDPAHMVRTAGDAPLSPPADRDGAELHMMADMEEDLQKLQMSRQDNPFLQQLQSSADDLVAPDDETDDARLVVTESGNSRQLALAEIHSHLVRSPPPIPWPRSSQKFSFDDLHEPARIVVCIEVIPRSNLRPLAAKDRGQVMDQCLQDILQTQRCIPLQKASAVDETFTGRLSPRTSPLRAPLNVRQLSPRRGKLLSADRPSD
ncbi:hypothetical protein FJT64_008545 [Amphibalanus amphitrite]|uniref:Uncharacterized protein n=1 Tax=Amphibalanus amphitrite TaxID=1232801 RepID=A0A6A4VH06_AMPAM|nr:hypothetical protein FJT64_008545 [Amphibalanus amphitrite]